MKKIILMLLGLALFITMSYLIVLAQDKSSVRSVVKKSSGEKNDSMMAATKETQFFCGYCHVLTYPEVLKKAHETWKADEKHNDVGCVECHYPPDMPSIPEHRRIPKTRAEADKEKRKKMTEWDYMNREIEVLSRLKTILKMDETTVLRKPKIDDKSCTTSDCHPTTGRGKKGEYWIKKLKFTEYEKVVDGKRQKVPVTFTHKEHYDKKKWVEGHELHCVTCHRKETSKKHFEVSKESCFLCHFKGSERMNVDRGKCSHCHKIPEEPFKKEQEVGVQPVTHKVLEERKVSCESCHLHLVRGKGEVTKEKCLACHSNDKQIMKDMFNKKKMHREHVAKQTASCFECHEQIEHKAIKEFTYADAGINTCTVCHSEPHRAQRLLLAGKGGIGVDKPYPIKHHDMNTNCIACHVLETQDELGREVKIADEKTCVDCHSQRAKDQLVQWKEELKLDLKDAIDFAKKAEEALREAKGKVPESVYKRAESLMKDGKTNLNLVRAGGGIHNKKYSTLLLDKAIGNFEAVLKELQKK